MALKNQTAKEYRLRFPDKPSHSLARIMRTENPALFRDAEDARSAIRRIEGKMGKANRNTNLDMKCEHRPLNPYVLPPSEEKPSKPFILKGHKRVAIFNDIHLPYHSIEAITTAFDYVKKQKPDAILINGDLLDFYQLSKFGKDPRERNFAYELQQFKQFFEVLEKTFKAKVYYKLGNHEVRYEHYLMQKAGELLGVEEFELKNILKARAEGITIIPDKTIIRANALSLLHGHEFGSSFFSPVNVARGLQLRAKVSAAQGHNHQTSEHTEKDLHGTIKTTWSIGCLCGLTPDYAPINRWNHGLALVDLDENKKDFLFHNKRIFNGQVL